MEVSDYKTELDKFGAIAFVPGGNSMWPMLKNRAQSVVVRRKTQRLKPLDVAFYLRDNGAFVLHRVMETIDGGYIMCGDSQLTKERVKEDNVFGVMEGFYHGKKYVEVTDARYIKKVKRWYGRKRWRKFRLKIFHFNQRVKNKLARIFKRTGK